jgi:excisionase family DNA binding protein
VSLDPDFAQKLDDLIEGEVMRRRDAVAPTYSVAQAAKLLGVSARTVHRKVKSGEIRSLEVVGKKRIPASEVERILSS